MFHRWITTFLVSLMAIVLSGCGATPDDEELDESDLSLAELDEPPPVARPAPPPTLPDRVRPEGRAPASQRSSTKKAEKNETTSDEKRGAKKGASPPTRTGTVAQLVKELKDPARGADVFRKLWEVPKSDIPALIELVESDEPTAVDRVKILITQKDFVGENTTFLANRIHGLGRMEELSNDGEHVVSQAYTRMSYGITGNKKGYFVFLEKFGGLPLGVVVRAGLLTRFRNVKFPSRSDDTGEPGDLIAWWREYYRRSSATLPPP